MPNTVVRTIVREMVADASIRAADRKDAQTPHDRDTGVKTDHKDYSRPNAEMKDVIKAATGDGSSDQ